jgi:predicted dehydrogenase
MQTRRHFARNVATGLAGSLVTGRVLGANDRVRVGIIGAGERGAQLTRELLASPGAEVAGFADVYTRRLEEAERLAPGAALHIDYRELLADTSIDAVVIATPQHLHAGGFIAAVDAGKHVYIEKTLALTVEDAKLMRQAAARARAEHKVVQAGHQGLSSGQMKDARNYLSCGAVGQITAIRAHMYRNSPHGKPQWVRPVYPDMTPDRVDWQAFLGPAPERPFDAARYVNWRLYRDYSGGNVHESMSHQLAFWYQAMGLAIPSAVTMTGGLYRWNDGREVPDTITVAMEHGPAGNRDGLLFSWDSGMGNNELGVREEVLGTDGTILRGQQIRYLPQKVTRPGGTEMLGSSPTAPRAHMENFLTAIRGTEEPNCPFEIGYRTSIACAMALRSYDEGRRVAWDPAKEEIV